MTTAAKPQKPQAPPAEAPGPKPENRLVVLKSALDKNLPAIRAVATKYVEPERLLKVAVVACSKSPKLLMCNATSVVTAVMQAAELGLDPSGSFGGCHLVPFRTKMGGYACQLIVDYRGMVDIAYRTGAVTFIESRVVYEGDKFLVEFGDSPRLVHVPALDGAREEKNIRCVYAVARVKESEYPLVEVMTLKEIKGIQARSRAKDDGPWVTDFGQMARKTVIKRICNYLPHRPAELSKAIERDNEAEFGAEGLTLAPEPDPGPAQDAPSGAAGGPQTPDLPEDLALPSPTDEAAKKITSLFP